MDFDLDPDFERDLLGSAYVHDLIEEAVQAAAARATDLAPDDPNTNVRDLHRSIGYEIDETEDGWRGRVQASNFKAAWFEEGASRVSPRPFLRPAVEEIIGPVEPAPRGGED